MTITYTDTDLLTRWFGFDATALTPNALGKAHSMMLCEIDEMNQSINAIYMDTGIDYSNTPYIEWVQAYRIWKQEQQC